MSAESLFLVISGLVLMGNELGEIPKAGTALKKTSRWFARFGVFIGLIDIALAIL